MVMVIDPIVIQMQTGGLILPKRDRSKGTFFIDEGGNCLDLVRITKHEIGIYGSRYALEHLRIGLKYPDRFYGGTSGYTVVIDSMAGLL